MKDELARDVARLLGWLGETFGRVRSGGPRPSPINREFYTLDASS